MLVTPLFLCGVPDGNLNLSSVFRHVDGLRQQELDLNTDISSNVSRWVRVGDVAKALLNGKDRAHGPLGGLLALLGVLVHLEVNNTTDDEIVLNLVGRQVIVTGPERTKHNSSAGLLLGQLRDVIVELDVNTVLVSAEDISPDTEQNVTLGGFHMEGLFTSLVTLR